MSSISRIEIINKFFVKDDFLLKNTGLKIFEELKQFLFNFDPRVIITASSRIEDNFPLMIINYWERIQTNGLGLAQIDDLIVFIVIVRLIILSIRYNIITGFIITGIGIIAGYLWYSSFVSLLFIYEHALYKNSLTFQLGIDTTQLRRVMEAQIQNSNYQIRLTNPIGVMAYAIGNGSLYEGHRIDIISMIISKIPDQFFRQDIECYYYLFYRKIIPITIRSILDFIDLFTAYAIYAFMTRINKRYCPYLIRWHWTLLLIFKFVEPFIVYLNYRIVDYSYNIVYPSIITLNLSLQSIEMFLLTSTCFVIITCHLSFVLLGMFHALCGQYFYVPFFVKNVELHIGPRNKYSIYSGGFTSWQDSNQTKKSGFIPKIWYGWFGRGTKNQNNFFVRLYNLIYRFIKKLVKKIRTR
uniref:Uncharacterized protein n=1 Tax=Licmophora sp. TaxID=2115823 RepID=A0A2U9NP85_9STRA|nr:hypothetical protein ycf90 [Licmophora sp.]